MPRLVVSIASEPIERVEADVAVVAFFSDDRPLRGSAGRVDWRLCGRLSHLLRANRLSGSAGEAALIPSQGGLRAPIVVTAGLGTRSAFDGARCRAAARDAVERGLKLRAETLALALLEAGAESMDLGARMEAVLRGALGAADSPQTGKMTLQLVAAIEERPAALEWLDSSRRRGLPEGLEFGVQRRADVVRATHPRGDKRLPASRSPSVK
jgi:hypothetical protein